ncbi:hypothetical protein [Pseudomonas sp. G3-19]
MAASFATQATAQEIKPGEFMCPIPVAVNDRAATREAIIKRVRDLEVTFVERSSWKAMNGKKDMVKDWDYTMIALHHAGRSHSCTPGAEQMKGQMGTDLFSKDKSVSICLVRFSK